MAAAMFTATASIKKSVAFINELELSKFPLLLTRIIGKLHLKDDRTFSEEEETRLQGALGLAAADLDSVIETLEFILQQAAYHTAKPGVLSQQLQELGLEDDKVKAIVDCWMSGARDTIQKLRQRTLVPSQLTDVNWRLNLQMAQASQSKMKISNAIFGLTLNNDDTKEKEKVTMEFTHDELYAFYNQLETIQKQLDGLS